MARILILEDDPSMARSLELNLSSEGFRVHVSPDISSARQALRENEFDLGVFDWELPDGRGVDLAAELNRFPILILTARDDEESAVEALSLGSVDFVRKSCGGAELLARIRRALYSSSRSQSKSYSFKGLSLTEASRSLDFDGASETLTPKEFTLALLLIKDAPGVVPRDRIIESIDEDAEALDRSLDSHVSQLRKKMDRVSSKRFAIKASYGIGYHLVEKESQ